MNNEGRARQIIAAKIAELTQPREIPERIRKRAADYDRWVSGKCDRL